MSQQEEQRGYECDTCGDTILDIVGIIQHDCERVLTAHTLSSSERNTLMYIEGRMVDHHGELDHHQMNHEDQQNIKLFTAAGILKTEDFSVREFTDAAWDLARDCRQMRADDWIDDDRPIGDVPGA